MGSYTLKELKRMPKGSMVKSNIGQKGSYMVKASYNMWVGFTCKNSAVFFQSRNFTLAEAKGYCSWTQAEVQEQGASHA